MQKNPGRPKGAKNIKDVVMVEPSRCTNQNCKSSRRGAYVNSERRDFVGQGLPYVAIIYRRCQCDDCGQWRVDAEKVYEPEDDLE